MSFANKVNDEWSQRWPWVQVYHKPPETFVSRTRLAVVKAEDLQAERAAEEDGGGDESTGAPSTSGEVRAREKGCEIVSVREGRMD